MLGKSKLGQLIFRSIGSKSAFLLCLLLLISIIPTLSFGYKHSDSIQQLLKLARYEHSTLSVGFVHIAILSLFSLSLISHWPDFANLNSIVRNLGPVFGFAFLVCIIIYFIFDSQDEKSEGLAIFTIITLAIIALTAIVAYAITSSKKSE